jgi:hypothetical protein
MHLWKILMIALVFDLELLLPAAYANPGPRFRRIATL